jgi:hypothetical protein
MPLRPTPAVILRDVRLDLKWLHPVTSFKTTFIQNWLKEALGAADYSRTDPTVMVAMPASPCVCYAKNSNLTKANGVPSSNTKI